MAPALEFTVTGTEALTRRLLELGQDAPVAARRAINLTLTSIRTLAARGLSAKLGVPQNRFAKSLWTWRAKNNDQNGSFRVGTRRLKLVYLKAAQRSSDVVYRYRTEYRGMPAVSPPFVREMPDSGHTGMFVRSTRPAEHRGGAPGYRKSHPGSWLPIGEVYGPALSDLFQRDLLQAALARANERLEYNLDHEINQILRKRVQAGDE